MKKKWFTESTLYLLQPFDWNMTFVGEMQQCN